MTRVQIPAYTDAWMRGDRFGDIVKITLVPIKRINTRAALLTGARAVQGKVEVAHVLMDRSNKVRRVILADCEVV